MRTMLEPLQVSGESSVSKASDSSMSSLSLLALAACGSLLWHSLSLELLLVSKYKDYCLVGHEDCSLGVCDSGGVPRTFHILT